MKKQKSVDLKTLWERASKTRRIESTSNDDGIELVDTPAPAPAPAPVQVLSFNDNVVENPQIARDVVVPENNLVENLQTLGTAQTEIGSNEPELVSNQIGTTIENAEPSHVSPIRDDDELEPSDDGIYDVDFLPHDPGKRIPIKHYGVNVRESVIRGYIALGPCQPFGHNFPITKIGGKPRRFVEKWFDEYKWLEYSVELDAAFCFVCYLFKHQVNLSGGDAFVEEGFKNWHMKKRIDKHVGGMSSAHNIAQYRSIRQLLIKLGKDHSQGTECINAQTMLTTFKSYEFVFMAHLLLTVFGYTDDLNRALQKRDQDIVNAVDFIHLTKIQLQLLREDKGWEEFLNDINSFCSKNGIKVVDMSGAYRPVGRDRRFFQRITNIHRFHVDMFLSVIDRQLQELNDRFDEVNTELLLCMASFNPSDSFAAFDKDNLVKLAGFYPNEFSSTEMHHLPFQLNHFIQDMRRDERFREVKTIVELSIKLVETKKSTRYDLVYKLLKLVLLLPVATASVERVFSSMNYVKNKLRNKMGDQYLNDCLVTFIERDFFLQVKDDDIIKRFQEMKFRKVKINL